MFKRLFFCSVFFLSSCGYHFDKRDDHPTISVSYVEGDQSGFLTGILVKEISSSGLFRYVNKDGDLSLKIKIIDKSNWDIGYRHNRNNEGSLKKTIRPIEGREKVTVEFSVFSQDKILGPFIISADADYDYAEKDTLNDLAFIDKNGNKVTALAYSLGQLETIDSAQSAALIPLYRNLSQKIVDLILAKW
jgi:hypothetical protein